MTSRGRARKLHREEAPPTPRREPAVSAGPAAPVALAAPPAADRLGLLAVQRLLGNRHVQRLVATRERSPRSVQRDDVKKSDDDLATDVNSALNEEGDALSKKPVQILNGLAMDQLLRVLERLSKRQNQLTLIQLLDDPLDRVLRRLPSGLGDDADQRIQAAVAAVKASQARARSSTKPDDLAKLQEAAKSQASGRNRPASASSASTGQPARGRRLSTASAASTRAT